MLIDKGIKIQNIYYMLSYAFQILKNKEYENLACEEFKNQAELLGTILVKGVLHQIKCGLSKSYKEECDELTTLRGKINMSESVKSMSFINKKLVCTYDEFTIDNHQNQIIKSTLNYLLKSDITKTLKKDVSKTMVYFNDVELIERSQINWKLSYDRNNKNYEMLINLCCLIQNGLLQSDNQGNLKMQTFLDEQRMCRLYEKFILEYYKTEFKQLKVSASQIKWKAEADNNQLALLPTMQTDIMLRFKNKTLIIDAKYYRRSMQVQYNKHTLHSSNMYQIFTYVKNADSNIYGEVSGMLLYAKTDEEITPNVEFNMSGNMVYVKNLDLGQDFSKIQEYLNSIAELILE